MTTIMDPNGSATLIGLHPNAARTGGGSGVVFDVRQLAGLGIIILDVEGGTGTTPTLAVSVQDSPDGTTGWATLLAFTGMTTFSSLQRRSINLGACRGFIRLAWSIGGTTPSYQFSAVMLGRPNT